MSSFSRYRGASPPRFQGETATRRGEEIAVLVGGENVTFDELLTKSAIVRSFPYLVISPRAWRIPPQAHLSVSSPAAMSFMFKPCVHSDLLLLTLPQGLPCLNVLSRASLIVGWTRPPSTMMPRMPMMTSTGPTSLGQRIEQVEQVVQSQISSFPWMSRPALMSAS